jgi:hypothetical protein
MWHVWGRGEVHMRIWVGSPDGKKPLEDIGVDGKILLKWIFK